jgi:hypothetical protein
MDAPFPVINKTYDLYKLVIDMNAHAEKRWRYSLCMSLETSVLGCIEELIMAKNAPRPMKAPYLIKSSAKLEIIVLKLRLMLELAIANETKIFQAQAMAADIGRQIGGWLHSENNA